jgi:2,4-dienoyl-CoA reductase-like NADH-dependent reductase (Old Yellow Enzyme family)
MAAAFPQPVRTAFKLLGKRFLIEYPFEEAYFLPYARQFREALSMPLILLGGITNRETMDLAMAEGFDFVAMGRALLAEPDLINRIQADGEQHSVLSKCTHCNQCMATIYSHTHCVVTGSPG